MTWFDYDNGIIAMITKIDLWPMLLALTSSSLRHLPVPLSRCFLGNLQTVIHWINCKSRFFLETKTQLKLSIKSGSLPGHVSSMPFQPTVRGVDHWHGEDHNVRNTPIPNHYQGSIEFNTANSNWPKGMHFLMHPKIWGTPDHKFSLC